MNKKALFADFFTTLNMLCGFIAILFIIKGNFITSIWLLFLAAVLDGVDGKIARQIHTDSTFGLQLDSLSDMVSFSVAPAVLVYQIKLHTLGIAGICVSFLPLIFSGIRLARFNTIQLTKPKQLYLGMPAPMATLTICSFIMFDQILPSPIDGLLLLAPVVIGTTVLMVSNLEFDKVPKLSLSKGYENTRNLSIFVLGLIFIPFFPEYVFFPLMIVYLCSAILRYFEHGEDQKREVTQ